MRILRKAPQSLLVHNIAFVRRDYLSIWIFVAFSLWEDMSNVFVSTVIAIVVPDPADAALYPCGGVTSHVP